jgi:hypothetical protein
MAMVWVLGVVLLAAAGAGIFIARARRPRAEGPAYSYFRCPGCNRRLRYLARQAGHKGACPTCRQSLTFPAAPRPTT